MAISVYEQLNNMGLSIDRKTIQQVSKSILQRAEQKNSQYNVESAKNYFQQRELGLSLYDGKVNTDVAKQIALNNSGLQVQLNQNAMASIQYLNAVAAQSNQQNTKANITIAVNEITAKEQPAQNTVINGITTQETAKDKNGSNPFYHGELLAKGAKQKDDNDDGNKAITSSIFI